MNRHFSAIPFAVIALGLAFLVNSLHRENVRLQQALDRQLDLNNRLAVSSRAMRDAALMRSLERQVEELRAERVRFIERNRQLEALIVREN